MKTRIISAIIMLAIFVPVVVIGGTPFAIFMLLLALMGLYEILKVRESKKEFPFILKIFAFLLVMFFTLSNFGSEKFVNIIDFKTVTVIIFLFLLPLVFINDNKKYNSQDALFLIGAVLFIGLSFNLILITRNYDINYLIYLFIITVITDTFALFTGSLIGKHKLAKNISPKKTVEGLIGGVIIGVIAAVAFYITVINPSAPLAIVVLVTAVLALLGQTGDLVFSSIKREFGKKDFANIIPGHGGVLDRFDSIIFVVLGFVLFINII